MSDADASRANREPAASPGDVPGSQLAGPPLLRVVRGNATAEELAALVAVIAARPNTGAPSEPPPSDAPGWGVDRPGLHAGHGAWRASAWMPGVRTRAGW